MQQTKQGAWQTDCAWLDGTFARKLNVNEMKLLFRTEFSHCILRHFPALLTLVAAHKQCNQPRHTVTHIHTGRHSLVVLTFMLVASHGISCCCSTLAMSFRSATFSVNCFSWRAKKSFVPMSKMCWLNCRERGGEKEEGRVKRVAVETQCRAAAEAQGEAQSLLQQKSIKDISLCISIIIQIHTAYINYMLFT